MTRSTSTETLRQIESEGLLSRTRLLVYRQLLQHGPCTAGELAAEMRQAGHKANDQRAFCARRLSELVVSGAVAETGARSCRESGRVALVYESSGRLPVKWRRKVSKRDGQIAALQAEVDQLQSRVLDLENTIAQIAPGGQLPLRIYGSR